MTFNSIPAVHVNNAVKCGGVMKEGSDNVFIGGPSISLADYEAGLEGVRFSPVTGDGNSLVASAGEILVARRFDARALPAERAWVDARVKAGDLPNLGSNYEIVAGSDPNYNCIGYAFQIRGRVAPDAGWGESLKREAHSLLDVLSIGGLLPGDLQKQLHALDRRVTPGDWGRGANDASVEPGVEKVAVYVKDGYVTHAALQGEDGAWTSKLGAGPVVRHSTLDSISGPVYGTPRFIYRRRRYP